MRKRSQLGRAVVWALIVGGFYLAWRRQAGAAPALPEQISGPAAPEGALHPN